MKILVTGAAGFIGFHVVQRFLRSGAQVIGLDNLNNYYDPQLKRDRLAQLKSQPLFQFHEGNLEDNRALDRVFSTGPFTIVIHLAAQAGVRYSLTHPETYVQSNLLGFANMLEACRRHSSPHLLYASSSSVYGLNAKVPFSVHDNVDHPVSLYAATKKANELMAHSYSHLFHLPTTGLRFFTVYGPWGRPDMAYYKFTEAILAKRPIDVYNHGELWRDFTYIDDIVEGVVRLSARPAAAHPSWDPRSPDPGTSSAPYRVYNIGNHQPVKLIDFIACLEAVLEQKAILHMQPMQEGDVLSTFADTADLSMETGFSPSTSLAIGLERFVQWYRAYHQV